MKLSVASGKGASDISNLCAAANLSGDIGQCGRTLKFSVLQSPTDKNVPAIDIPLGAGVALSDSGTMFEGYVFSRQKLTDSGTIELTAFDRGIYVKRNQATYKFENMSPEDITRRVCADYGINAGAVAPTGVMLSRNFIGVTLYKIIQTVYTLAARQTGEAYHIVFSGDRLNVKAKGVDGSTLVIKGGSNLISAAVTESAENMVNQVAIYENDSLLNTVANGELIRLHGLMQSVIKQAKGEDAELKARKMLEDNGVSHKITVNNLGDSRCATGNAVVVQEPYTGLHGLFWIDADLHTWKNGQYFNKLTLNFRRMMDEQEAGSLPAASGAASGGKKEPVADKLVRVGK